ncbi:MAG: hypothetical protein KUG77_10230 [Nannocystaceae bacterium]|nr:hypothetical protein [Nannocystaceae bacterium]
MSKAWAETELRWTLMDPEMEFVGACLLALRWFVALRLQPHWAAAVGPLWWPAAAAVAVGVAASVDAPSVVLESAPSWALAIGTEALLGAGLGVLASLPAYALLGGATASAVALRTTPAPLVRMSVSGALVAALCLRLHHPALFVLRDQAQLLPPAQPELWLPAVADLPGVLALHLDGMLILALTLATPVLLTVVILQAAADVVGAGPTVSAPISGTVAPALATLGAVMAFAASWGVYPSGWARSAVSVAAG